MSSFFASFQGRPPAEISLQFFSSKFGWNYFLTDSEAQTVPGPLILFQTRPDPCKGGQFFFFIQPQQCLRFLGGTVKSCKFS